MKDYLLTNGSGYGFDESGNLLCEEKGNFVSYDESFKRSVLSHGGRYVSLYDGKKLIFKNGKFFIV